MIYLKIMTFIKEQLSKISFHTQNGVMFKWNDNLGTNFYFIDHHRKIMNVRFKDEDERKKLYNIQLTDHLYLNKTFVKRGKKYIIDEVFKQWYMGYYLTMLFKDENNSHGQLTFENISCHEPDFIKEINSRKVKNILKQLQN